jgi:Fe-Mn family superoxide dismutase
MQQFTQKQFNIGPLKGISAKNIEEHLNLYAGYVKHANLVREKIQELKLDSEKNAYALSEVNRRFSFEYNGMRNHEVYFASLEGGANSLPEDNTLALAINKTWGSFENWQNEFKSIAMTRGIGWVMLFYDKDADVLINTWVDEQHLGQLQDCALILGLDMWEHSYVADYQPSGKKTYIEDFFLNVNWSVIAKRFNQVYRQ